MRNLHNDAPARNRLPNRRPAETFELEVAGLRYTCTVGRFSDGTIGEIFLQNHKPASQSDCNARDAAVAASLALQFGCTLEVLRHALLRDSQGRPSTPLGAAVDAIAEGRS
jgi:ribonucleoside-diphosphate reductase alpha chain